MDFTKKYKYKLETHLKLICDENEEYANLLASWNLGKETYKELLSAVNIYFPHYSKHDYTHSENIITNIEMLLGEECIRKLSPTDTWLILNCAYLHDSGMVLLDENLRKDWKTGEFQKYLKSLEESNDIDLRNASRYINNMKDRFREDKEDILWPLDIKKYVTEIIANYYRGKHSQTSKEYLSDMNIWGIDFTQNGLIHDRLINLIAEISFAHNQGFDEIMRMNHMTNGYNSDYAHPRFVAELIRIGDLLDLDNGRFSPYLKKVTGNNPNTSQVHNKKHQATMHILVTPEDIQIKIDCPNDKVYRETRKWIIWLESEIRNITLNVTNIVPRGLGWYSPRITKKELLIDGKPDTNNITDLKFHISQEKAFEIIKGSNLYEDNWVFIREFVQNALDASKIQLWNDIQEGLYDPWLKEWLDGKNNLKDLTPFHLPKKVLENYKIEVKISYKGKNDKDEHDIDISIKDRGTGISIERLKSMCDVGNSYSGQYNKDNEHIPTWLVPTGGFGIGLQSAFLVTDKFRIYTKTSGLNPYKIDISSYDSEGYITVREHEEDIKRGTEICFSTDKLPKTLNSIEREYDIKDELNKKIYNNDYEVKDPFYNEKEESQIIEFEKFKDIQRNVILLKKYIQSLFNNTIFPLYIKINDEELFINSLEFVDSMCNNIDGSKSIILSNKKDNYYYYLSEDLSTFLLWDYKNSIYADVNINKGSILDRNLKDSINLRKKMSVCFKGCKVLSYFKMPSKVIITTIDFYGLDTKENLRINREQFTVKGFKNIQEEIEKIEIFYLHTVKSIIDKNLSEKSNIDEIKKVINIDLCRFFKLYSYSIKEVFDISPYIPILHNDKLVPVLTIDNDEKIVSKNMGIKEILEMERNVSYIDANYYIDKNYYTEYLDIDLNLAEDIITKYNTIIIDKHDYFEFFNRFMHRKEIYIIESQQNHLSKIIINSSEKNKFEIKDDFTKKIYLYSYVLQASSEDIEYKIRYCINNIKGYEELLVDKIPDEIEEKVYSDYFKIILPFNSSDIKRMESCKDEDEFINELKDRTDYNNLLDYTLKHKLKDCKKTREDLSSKYQELVKECIKILKDETLKKYKQLIFYE